MDIHPPTGPVGSLKEFGIHIAIVTVGILIALSLEGVIESVHDARLVRETRRNFQFELVADRRQASLELARNREIHKALDELVAELSLLMKNNPQAIQERLSHIRTAGYFLPAEAWQAALSTGALAHMDTDEVERYAMTYYILHAYTDIQKNGIAGDDRAQSFFLSRSLLKPADQSEAAERVVAYAQQAKEMEQVSVQMQDEIDQALGAQ